MNNYSCISESVTEGHPDKICDKISDKILDCALEQDLNSKMAVEATIKDELILIYGEASTNAILDYSAIAKYVLRDIGYYEEYNVIVKVSEQSREISNMVNKNVVCAGDQGIMFGYACNDNEELMPLSILLANKLAKRLTECRKSEEIDYLLPDGKTQVKIDYIDNKPNRIDYIIISTQHKETISLDVLRKDIIAKVILKVVDKNLIDKNTKMLINTNGTFIKGGSFGDSGTTGRKIVVDSYGGSCKVGGGCFSSKDPSKVDRSAAYYARYVAKNVVAHKYADKCEISVSYAIGNEGCTSISINTYNTNKVSENIILKYINDNFNFNVQNIIEELDLRKPIYYDLAAYGHFGRNTSWEQIKS